MRVEKLIKYDPVTHKKLGKIARLNGVSLNLVISGLLKEASGDEKMIKKIVKKVG